MNGVTILIAGDYSPKECFQKAIDDGDYKDLFQGLREIISSADYSVVNFETTIPTLESKPIEKVGSHLYAKENSLEPLKYLGFKMLTMANNHFLDYGSDALKNSKKLAKDNGFDTVGAGDNLSEARKYKVVDIKGCRVAFINVCEHEFSIATETQAGCNPLDIISVTYDIKSAKNESDYVIVIVHGGNEHYKLPSPRMKKMYRFFVDQGADVVLNHHQHCYSGYEVYNGKPIFYGLGNFCFDSRSDIQLRHETYNYGYMVKLELGETIAYELIPYEQCFSKPGVYLLGEEERVVFFKDIDKLNLTVADDDLLKSSFLQMAKQKRDFIYGGFRPYTGRISNALYYRGLLPSFLSKKRLKAISAVLECESHNDVLLFNLKSE